MAKRRKRRASRARKACYRKGRRTKAPRKTCKAKAWKLGKTWCAIRPGLKHAKCGFKSRAAALRGAARKRRK